MPWGVGLCMVSCEIICSTWDLGLLGRDPTQSHVPLENRDWVMVPCKVVASSGCDSGTRRGDCVAMGVTSALNYMMTVPEASGEIHYCL